MVCFESPRLPKSRQRGSRGNVVRIIQRFGPIDRIGSVNSAVHLVNFWPTEDLNKYINLKNRVEARMALVDLSATFEDNVLKNE